MPKVVVRGPWSRRRMLAWAAGLAGVVGAAKLAVWRAGNNDGPAPEFPSLPTPAGGHALALAVAVPTGGLYAAETDATHAAIAGVLEEVNAAAAGRFRLEVMEIPQPDVPVSSYQRQPFVMAPLMASGGAPDLLVFAGWHEAGATQREFGTAVELKWTEPLDAHLRRNPALPVGDFYPAALDVCRHHDQLHGVPLRATPLLLLYDAPLLASAGIGMPTTGTGGAGGWDWGALRSAAERLTRDLDGDGVVDQYGLCLYPGPRPAGLLSLVWQNGGELVSADRSRALADQPAAVEAFEFFAGLHGAGGKKATAVIPPLLGTAHLEKRDDALLLNGRWRVAMMYAAPGSSASAAGTPWLAQTEVPRGRRRAAALGVSATVSVYQKARDRATAADALALLADRVTKTTVPPPRRRRPADLAALKPQLALADAQAVLSAMESARVLVLDDVSRTAELHNFLATSVVPMLRAPAVAGYTAAGVAARASQGIQQRLSQPRTP